MSETITINKVFSKRDNTDLSKEFGREFIVSCEDNELWYKGEEIIRCKYCV